MVPPYENIPGSAPVVVSLHVALEAASSNPFASVLTFLVTKTEEKEENKEKLTCMLQNPTHLSILLESKNFIFYSKLCKLFYAHSWNFFLDDIDIVIS